MLLNPAYLFDEERQEFSYHSFIMRDFQEVRVKTWDWTEPVSAEEVLEDTLQARTMRNAPVDGKLPVGSTEPTENIVYYDDLADHDFPDDSEMSLDDSAVLPGMEVKDYLGCLFRRYVRSSSHGGNTKLHHRRRHRYDEGLDVGSRPRETKTTKLSFWSCTLSTCDTECARGHTYDQKDEDTSGDLQHAWTQN
ncbi:hypothetical protein R1sor_023141 [Riccia sorocarpa]|uniref:Uncharacterized protein n=1 Tax=Riccia sorocarpa TaxID=122646 RepID=A0ABD3GQ58_9MARC